MKKIVRLTESDLVRLVKRVINEDYTMITTDGKGNIIFNGEKWELWSGWVKIEITSLIKLPNGNFKMNYDTSLTSPDESIISKEKIDGIMNQARDPRVTKIPLKIIDKKGVERELTLIKK